MPNIKVHCNSTTPIYFLKKNWLLMHTIFENHQKCLEKIRTLKKIAQNKKYLFQVYKLLQEECKHHWNFLTAINFLGGELHCWTSLYDVGRKTSPDGV